MLPDEPDDKPGSTPAEAATPNPPAPEAGEATEGGVSPETTEATEALPAQATEATSPPEDALVEVDAAAASAPPLFALGEPEQAPLAAVFKRRRGGGGSRERRSSRRDGEPIDKRPPEGGATSGSGSYDVVLTDAFRVPDSAVISEEDIGPPMAVEAGPPPSAGTAAEEGEPPLVVAPPQPAPSVAPPTIPPAAARSLPPTPPEVAVPPPPVETPVPDIDDSIEIPDDTEPAARVGVSEAAVDLDPVMAVDAILSLARKSAAVRRTPTAGAWFADLFGNDYFLAHPQRLGPSTLNEVEFIESALRAPAGGRLLDVCCGYGRHTVPLAAKGYELVGLDLSLDMLKAALGRAQASSLAIKFVHGDMRDLNFKEVFDGAFCFDSSFGFFTEPENLMVLRGVFDAVKRGGRFILEVANRDYALRGIPTRNWWEGDGCLVQEDIEFDHLTSRLAIKRFAVFADGMQREYNISMRLYAVHELLRMFQMVGFEILEISGNRHTAGLYFGPESNRIIMVAEKPASRA